MSLAQQAPYRPTGQLTSPVLLTAILSFFLLPITSASSPPVPQPDPSNGSSLDAPRVSSAGDSCYAAFTIDAKMHWYESSGRDTVRPTTIRIWPFAYATGSTSGNTFTGSYRADDVAAVDSTVQTGTVEAVFDSLRSTIVRVTVRGVRQLFGRPNRWLSTIRFHLVAEGIPVSGGSQSWRSYYANGCRYVTTLEGDGENNGPDRLVLVSGSCEAASLAFSFTSAADTSEVRIWQAQLLRASTPGQFAKRGLARATADTGSFVVTYTVGTQVSRAPMMWAWADSIMWRVPEGLMGNRLGVTTWPVPAFVNAVELVQRKQPGGGLETLRRRDVRVDFPRRLLYDELRGVSPALVQGVLRGAGPPFSECFMFIGRPADQHGAVRITNTTKALTAPSKLLGKVITPGGTYYDSGVYLTPGNLPLVGSGNASQQFPVTEEGLYLIVCEAESPESAPTSFLSHGPFPAYFQIHLAGNAGLPQKDGESGRATRFDTYFNAPAPREQDLGNQDPASGQIAQESLCKFASPVTPSSNPIAILLPPSPTGYPPGVPPVRSRPPLLAGQILPGQLDPTTPTARTRALVDSIALGDVIDWTQVPLPGSLVVPGAGTPGIAQAFGGGTGGSVGLPFTTSTGSASSIIFDMGSGQEIVDGTGADFCVYGTEGSYTAAVSNTPFAGTFRPLMGGNPQTGVVNFDLSGSGLAVARYVLVTAAPTCSIGGLKALNQFIDFVHATAGPMVGTATATMTVRRIKSPVGPLDPYMEFIGPDGSFLGENESGYGDVTSTDRSDAALVKKTLPAFGFYRFTVRGYPLLPDEQAFGHYFARLETGGEWDQGKIVISQLSEAETNPQRQGTISETRQRNSFLFEAQPGSTVKMSVSGGSSPALVDPLVELYDPEDFLIAASDNYAGRGKYSAISVILPVNGRGGGALPNPSTYRIVVSALDTIGAANALSSGGTGYIRTARSGNFALKVFTGAMTGGEPTALLLSGVAPNAVAQGASGVILHLAGANFQAAAQVSISTSGAAVRKVEFTSAAELQVTVDVDNAATLGKHDITVSIPGGESVTLPRALDICRSVGKVSLLWDAPAAGGQGPPLNLRSAWSMGKAGGGGTTLAGSFTGRGRFAKGSKTAGRIAGQGLPHRVAGVQAVCYIQEAEPNNLPVQAQTLGCSDTTIAVYGRAQLADSGVLDYYDGDDIEDLFRVTTKAPGLRILLSGFTSDCDLYLLSAQGDSLIDGSLMTGVNESEYLEEPDLPAGTYLVGVSIFEPDPIGPDTTSYSLALWGSFSGGGSPGEPVSYVLYRSVSAGAKTSGKSIATIPAGTVRYDDNLPSVGQFYYQLTALYGDGSESAPSNEAGQTVSGVKGRAGAQTIPIEYDLGQNYPNPFNPSTRIQYALPHRSQVTLTVYSTLGQRVAELVNGEMEAGYHEAMFQANGIASGVYFYRMSAVPTGDQSGAAGTGQSRQARNFVQVRKLLLVR